VSIYRYFISIITAYTAVDCVSRQSCSATAAADLCNWVTINQFTRRLSLTALRPINYCHSKNVEEISVFCGASHHLCIFCGMSEK